MYRNRKFHQNIRFRLKFLLVLKVFVCFFSSEENVWKLCEKIRDDKISDLKEFYAVFVSNDDRQVMQLLSKGIQNKA